MAEPKLVDLVAELRKAVGLFDGAMPISPKEAWDEAIEHVRYQRTVAGIALNAVNDVNCVFYPEPRSPSWMGTGV